MKTKHINFNGRTYTIVKYPDGLWRDAYDTIYGLAEDENSVDKIVRCGIGPLSLPESSPINDFCKTHDAMYSTPAYQLFHTRLEADEALKKTLELGGYWFAKPFYYIARVFGGLFWEGRK